ncbi:MAG TPA: dihydrodipicolinate synthase family protein [Xanthobacteraceae bacterium]|nr:dihydrodipicolinate synthase family protein [Xanthobacteraceae bacterium]
MKAKPLALRGLYPAPSVPFDRDLKIIEGEFARHLAAMGRIDGLGGVAVNGHQGEVAALTPRERLRVVELARENLPKDKHVVAGVLSPSIDDMAQQMKDAKRAGADAALVIPPFDYMPRRVLTRSWQAPYGFFAGLADRCDLPIVVFQYPFASNIYYSTEAMTRIAEIDTVVGVKHAIRNLGLYAEQWEALRGKISVLAARDAPGLLTKMFVGSDGCCIGIANIAPEHWAAFTTQCLESRYNEARETFMTRLLPLMQHCWAENQPRATTHSASTKEALRLLGVFSSSRVRPPEQDVDEEESAEIRIGLEKAGLLAVPRLRAAG